MPRNPKTYAPRALRRPFALVLALAALVSAGEVAHARRAMPLAVRITGYVGAKPDGVITEFEWVVAHRRDEVRLYIQRLFVKTGDASPGDIDRAVNPYPVQFQLAGQKAALEQLKTVAAGTRVVIESYLDMGGGARMMMLDTVEVAAEPTKPGVAPSKP